MEKQIVKKIISLASILLFAIFFIQLISPFQTYGATKILDWDNPNKNGNPYSFKFQNPLKDPGLYTQVIGCTGIVDKVSEVTMSIIQNPKKILELKRKAVAKMCGLVKATATTGAASAYSMNFTDSVREFLKCDEIQKQAADPEQLDATIKIAEEQAKQRKSTECFNGIAIMLAKNQLTSMTRYTMNWVNSGFNGNPMYVRDITSFTNSIERNILEKEVNKFTDRNMAYPYGSDFSRSLIRSYRAGGFRSGFDRASDNLISDLSVFLTDTDSYYGSTSVKTPAEREKEAGKMFATDFLTGGWDGWLALTQRDSNNPLGFTMLSSQYIAEEQTYQNEEIRDELFQNNGFLNQKKCVEWQVYESEYVKKMEDVLDPELGIPVPEYVFSPEKTSDFDQCVKYKNVTPGSIIKDKVSYYINSPERQLELADTINESLNGLFTAIISQFQNNGLSSLKAEDYVYSDPDNMGQGLGSNYWLEGTNFIEDSSNESSSGGSGGFKGNLDLTRDLGNTYIHGYEPDALGTWNARDNQTNDSNNPVLRIGLAPKICNPSPEICTTLVPADNGYYVVNVAGTTKLFENGYSGWAVGDRAFWDGTTWQNWKKDISNPIKKRGIIQTQKDFIVAAKETLKILPGVIPKIAELDYCIPGPNPSFEINYTDTATAFSNTVSSLGTGMRDDKITYQGHINGKHDAYKKFFVRNVRDRNDPGLGWWYKAELSDTFQSILSFTSHWNNYWPTNADNRAMEAVDYIVDYVSNGILSFANKYKEVIAPIYGDGEIILPESNGQKRAGILKQYLYNETDPNEKEPNTNYLPMAEEGLAITKDLLAYKDDIDSAIQKLKDDMAQAEVNTAKLMQIKEYVAVIVQAAQARRDAKLLEFLNEKTEEHCDNLKEYCLGSGQLPQSCQYTYEYCMQDILTLAEYKDKFNVCIDEENIIYYDDLDIMNGTDMGELRCNDNLDNDLDGKTDMADSDCNPQAGVTAQCDNGIDDDGDQLIDMQDPGCSNQSDLSEYNVPNGGGGGEQGYCVIESSVPTTPHASTASCGSFVTETECEDHIYYHQGSSGVGNFKTTCTWSPDGSGGSGGVSMYGCMIKPKNPLFHPTQEPDNTHCDLRPQSDCTTVPYYSNEKEYECRFLPL